MKNIKENLIEVLMKKYKIPGVSIAIIKDYKISKVESFGYSDFKNNNKVNQNTIFQAASLSKTITSVVFLQLVEEKKITLDESLNKYFLNFGFTELGKSKIKLTARKLLSHINGINSHGFAGYNKKDYIPNINEILLGKNTNSKPVKIIFNNDGKFNYSGGGYVILQKIIEFLEGKTFEKVAKDRIFNRLKLKRTTFSLFPKGKNISLGYKIDKKTVKGGWHLYPEQTAAGLWSNPSELSKIFIEIMLAYLGKSNKILSKFGSKELLKVGKIYDIKEEYDGLGIFVKKEHNKLTYYHNGANAGFRCSFQFSLDGSGYVIMTNSDNGLRLINNKKLDLIC